MKKVKVVVILVMLLMSLGVLINAGTVNKDYQSPIVKVVNLASPAVVKIETVRTRTLSYYDPFSEDFFKRYFGFPFGAPQVPQRQFKQKVKALGSGFIFDEKGYIFTNAHVVEGADKGGIKVILLDGKEYTASLVGIDTRKDIAIIKIDPHGKGLPTVELGDSSKLSIGEWAIAVGNPLGFQHTVTFGVVSALDRKIPKPNSKEYYYHMIQTDAAINPGNSGGPLLNIHGQVIGINTAIVVNSEGLGFAIPINTAKDLMNDLINKGKVIKAFLGVSVQDVTPDIKEGLGLKSNKGAIVVNIVPNSPADKAGLKYEDVIIAVDDQSIGDADELVDTIQYKPVNSTVKLTVERNGEDINLYATLVEKPKKTKVAVGGEEKFGIVVTALTDALRAKYAIPKNIRGVIVLSVKEGSLAQNLQIQVGDVIMKIGRKSINNLDDWHNTTATLKDGSKVVLYLYSNGNRYLLTFTYHE